MRSRRRFLIVVFTVVLVGLGFSFSQDQGPIFQTGEIQEPFKSRSLISQEIGSVVLTEHGSKTYLGGNSWSYSTSLGETNTWNGSHYVSYIYDDISHNATFAGHSLVLYDWYTTFSDTNQVLVDDMRWIIQYWQTQAGGRWAELDLWDHSFLPSIETENSLSFGQRYTDHGSTLDVWYTVHNYDQFKITLNFTAQNTELYRFQWQLTGVDGSPTINNKSITFDDVNIGWDDAELNATYEWTVATKKLDISFDSLTIGAGEIYTLDPSVNPVLGADSDDDWWNFDQPSTWIHYTNGITISLREPHVNYWYVGGVRFVINIASGSTITSATLSLYEDTDQGDNDANVYRISEDNVGSLEADTTFPVDDYSEYASWDFDGVALEWRSASVTDLVQTQIDLGGWNSGQYMGFHINQTDVGAGTHFKFEDYQNAGTNHGYMNVTYTTGGAEYTEHVFETIPLSDSSSDSMNASKTINEIIQIQDSTSVSAGFGVVVSELIGIYETVTAGMSAVLTIMEQINFSENVSVGANFVLTILQVLGLAATVVTTKGSQITIFEGIGFSDITTTTQQAQFYIYEVIGFTDLATVAASYSSTFFESIGLSDLATVAALYPITIFESVGISDTILATQQAQFYIYETIGFISSTGVTGGILATPTTGSMIYQLFFSLEMWGYLGPITIVILGYIIANKDKSLGVLWFVVESLIIVNYLTLVSETPDYWWHTFILIIGCILTLMYSVGDR